MLFAFRGFCIHMLSTPVCMGEFLFYGADLYVISRDLLCLQYHCKDSLHSGNNGLVYYVLTFDIQVPFVGLNTMAEE